MPFKSEKQRKWMHANKPKMAKKWEKEEKSVEEDRDYKAEYKKFQSSTKAKKYRAELNKYNRQKGTYGNGDGKDASHKGGKIVGFEAESTNRGRAEKSRLKKEDITMLEAKFTDDTLASRIKHWRGKHKGTGIGYGHVLAHLAVHMKEMGWNKSYKEVASIAVELGKKRKVESVFAVKGKEDKDGYRHAEKPDFKYDPEKVNEGKKSKKVVYDIFGALQELIFYVKGLRKIIDDGPYNRLNSTLSGALYKWEIELEKKLRLFAPQLKKLAQDKMLESVNEGFDKYRLGGLLDSKLKKRLERTIKIIGGKVDAVGDDYVKFRISSMDLAKLPSVIKKLDRNKNVWIGNKLNKNIWDRRRNINKLGEGFGGELKGKDKQKFEKARKENAEQLGYKLTGITDIKESILKETPAASAAAAMAAIQVQNAQGKKIKGTSALQSSDPRVQKKAKGIFKRLKDKFAKGKGKRDFEKQKKAVAKGADDYIRKLDKESVLEKLDWNQDKSALSQHLENDFRRAGIKILKHVVMKGGYKGRYGAFITVKDKSGQKVVMPFSVKKDLMLHYDLGPKSMKLGKVDDASRVAAGLRKLQTLPGFGQSKLAKKESVSEKIVKVTKDPGKDPNTPKGKRFNPLLLKGEEKIKALVWSGSNSSGKGSYEIKGNKLNVNGINPRDKGFYVSHFTKNTGIRRANLYYDGIHWQGGKKF